MKTKIRKGKRMLNWRIEEEDYVKKAIEKYFEKANKNPFSFLMSDKTRRKNIQYVTDIARNSYRQKKLEKYEEEIIEERKRIDKVVEELNNKYEEFINNQKFLINDNIKPFNIEAKNYSCFNQNPLGILEIVTIQSEPLKLSFIQEKIGSDK